MHKGLGFRVYAFQGKALEAERERERERKRSSAYQLGHEAYEGLGFRGLGWGANP